MNMKKATNSQHSGKKKAAAVMLIFAMLIATFGGTLAFRDYNQHKTNEASNKLQKYDVTLVENFREKKDWKVVDGELTKQISVKNTGLTDGTFDEVYARIQLKEYMDFKPMVVEETPERYMIDTTGAFITFGDDASAIAAYPGHVVKQLTDAISGKTAWFVQTKEHDDNGQYGKHVVLKYELDAKEYLVGDATMEDARKDAQVNRKHNQKPNAECDYPIHEWDGVDLAAVLAQPDADQYISWVLGTEVVLYSEWVKAPTYGPFWIVDDRPAGNGWVYWGEALFPGQETAKFLEAIELIEQPKGDFYYAIHTEMEALSLDELFGSDAQWTDMPDEIKESYVDNAPQVVIIDKTSGNPAAAAYTIKQGEVLTLDAEVKPATVAQTVTWSVSPDTGIISYVNGSFIITGEKPGTVVVTATSDANGKYNKVNVTVTNEKTLNRTLEELIEQAKQAKTDEDLYEPVSFGLADLDPAILSGETALDSDDDGVVQAAIDLLEESLGKLVKKEVVKDQLAAALDEAKALLDYDIRDGGILQDYSGTGNGGLNIYLPTYLDELHGEVDDAIALLANPTATDLDLQAALDTIQNLLDNKELKPSKSVLETILGLANGLNPATFTTDSWTPFATILADANTLFANPNATALQIEDMITSLQTAMGNEPGAANADDSGILVRKGSAAALNALIADSNAAEVLGTDKYTSGSLADLDTALDTTGRVAVDPSNMTQTEIDALYAILSPAYDGLVDIEDLTSAVTDANLLDPIDYEDFSDVQDAIDDAETVLSDPDATQQEVDDALAALELALSGLVPVDKIAALNAVISGAKNPDDYTTASWASSGYGAQLALLSDMKTALEGNPAAYTTAQVNAAIADLTSKESGLVLRGDPTALNSLVNSIKGESLVEADYTSGTWNALQTAITSGGDGAMAAKPDLSQTQIDALKGDVQDAYDGLIDISDLLNAINAASFKISPAATADGTWDKAGEFNLALANAKSTAGYTSQAAVDALKDALITATTNLVKKPVVTSITVTDGGNGGANVADGSTVNIPYNASSRIRYFSATISGEHAFTDAANWTISGAGSGTGKMTLSNASSSKNVTLNIPANFTAGGTATITATSVNDSSKTVSFTVTVANYINITAFTLKETCGCAINNGSSLAVGSVSSVSTIDFVSNTTGTGTGFTNIAKWEITGQTGTGATITDVDAKDGTLTIPSDYVGTVTVKAYAAQDFTEARAITFNVVINTTKDLVNSLSVGDTFIADGYAWRILHKDGDDVLVITEHVIKEQRYHSATHANLTWRQSDMRAYLNGGNDNVGLDAGVFDGNGLYQSFSAGFQALIKPTTLSSHGQLDTDNVFLLSESEMFMTGDTSNNIYPGVTLFADDAARKTTKVPGISSGTFYYWLRTRKGSNSWEAYVDIGKGTLGNASFFNHRGVRPCVVLDLS
jgi:hypothetical protein